MMPTWLIIAVHDPVAVGVAVLLAFAAGWAAAAWFADRRASRRERELVAKIEPAKVIAEHVVARMVEVNVVAVAAELIDHLPHDRASAQINAEVSEAAQRRSSPVLLPLGHVAACGVRPRILETDDRFWLQCRRYVDHEGDHVAKLGALTARWAR